MIQKNGATSDLAVNLVALQKWMDGHGIGSGPITDAHLLDGGTQNILVRFTRGNDSYVLRRPPVHKRSNSDETNRREARILGTLSRTAVPHPLVIAACDDTETLGAAFYLMEAVDGINPTEGLPTAWAADPASQHALGIAVVEGLVALKGVDVAGHGLLDLGNLQNWLQRQVGRWRKQLDSYSELAGYQGPALPHLDRITDWLVSNTPRELQPGLIHGDYHFANVLVSPSTPELAAIVDWELSTIGDVRLDLGHLLATWPHAEGPTSSLNTVLAPGLPTVDEVIAHYAAATGGPVEDLTWFRVLACYRLGILLEGSNARACAGRTTREIGDRLGALATQLFEQADTLLPTR